VAKQSSLITHLEHAIENGLREIGKHGVKVLREQEVNSDTTGRLADSFSYATAKTPAKSNGTAKPTDLVPQPSEPHTLVIGTRTPYAVAVNYGYGSMQAGPFKYGQNGNASNYEDLVSQILAWLKTKGISDDIDFAYNIASQIEDMGTMAHPFWEDSVMLVEQSAQSIMSNEIKKAMSKTTTEKTEVTIKMHV
jgi:hypothetical protein